MASSAFQVAKAKRSNKFQGGDFVGTNASTSSTPVTWEAVDDEGSNLFYPILIAVIIAIGGGVVIMRNRSS